MPQPHPLAAATCRGFKHYRISEFSRELLDLRERGKRLDGPGHYSNTGYKRGSARGDLRTHDLHCLRTWANEAQIRFIDSAGEFGILSKESIARMDSFGSRLQRGCYDPGDVEIAL